MPSGAPPRPIGPAVGKNDDARARFEALGFPTVRDEAWRQTNVAPIALVPFVEPARREIAAARIDALPLEVACFASRVSLSIFVQNPESFHARDKVENKINDPLLHTHFYLV